MSLFRRMMASVGVGSATVDTVLHSERVRAGEPFSGVVRVQGGSVSQAVEAISLNLMTQYRREVNDRTTTESVSLGAFRVADAFTLGAGEVAEFPFEVLLPDETPATLGRTPVWLKTAVGIAAAVDPTDNDYLEVLPHRHSQVVFDALASLGFQLRKVECEYSRRRGGSYPFLQQFEFMPTTYFRGQLDELEAVCFPGPSGLDLWLEVDRRARGFGGVLEAAFDADESRLRVGFALDFLAAGPQRMAQYLHDLIAKHAR